MLRKYKLALIGILVLAAVLRLAALLKYGDFWDDEMFNFIYSQKAWPHGLIYWLWETNPPLHLLTLKLWFYIFPATEFFARLPSVIAGIATVYVVYRFGRDLYGEKIGLLAAFYLAIHPYHIFWSATARVYSLLMLLTVCSAWLLYKQYLLNDDSKFTKRMSVAVNLMLVFAHLSSLFFFAGEFIFLLTAQGKKASWNWIKSNMIPFAAGALWIGASFCVKSGNSIGNAWFFNMQHTWQSAMNPLVNLVAGQFNIYSGCLIVLVLAGLFSYTAYKDTKNYKKQTLYIFTLVIIPLLLSFAFNVWHIKFFLGVLPLLAIVIPYLIFSQTNRAWATLLILTVICSVGLYNLRITLPLSDWQSIGKYIDLNKKNKTALVYNNYILKTQIDRYLRSAGIPSVPLILYADLDWDDMVVKKNYIFTQISEQEKNAWYEKNDLDKFDTIILLQGEYVYMNKLGKLFADKGWRQTMKPSFARISGNYMISTYEKNK